MRQLLLLALVLGSLLPYGYAVAHDLDLMKKEMKAWAQEIKDLKAKKDLTASEKSKLENLPRWIKEYEKSIADHQAAQKK